MTPYRPYTPPASTGQPQGEPLPPTTPPLPRTDQIAPPEAPFEKPAPTPTPEQPKAPAPLSKEEQAVADAEKAHELAMQISPDQLSTQEDLDKLIEATKKAYRNAQDQPIALEFITGQLSSLENRALGLAEPLEKKLARLQAQRTSALESSKFGLERSQKKADTARGTEVGGRMVRYNPATGKYETLYAPPKEAKVPEPFTLGPGQIRYDAQGKVIARGGPREPTETEIAKALEKTEKQEVSRATQASTIGLLSSILSSDQLSRISGSRPGRFLSGAGFTGTAGIRGQLQQVEALTSLEGREKLKGSGAISDFEANMLAESANSLNAAIQDDGQIAMSDKEVAQNLKNMKGILQLKAGLTMSAIITNPATGESIQANLTSKDAQELWESGSLIDFL